jgi:trimeric autotransporter adhesin
LAQQVNDAAKKIDFNFSGIDLPSNEQTLYGLRYAELVVPLIQSVKELKAIIDEQQKQIDALKKVLQIK